MILSGLSLFWYFSGFGLFFLVFSCCSGLFLVFFLSFSCLFLVFWCFSCLFLPKIWKWQFKTPLKIWWLLKDLIQIPRGSKITPISTCWFPSVSAEGRITSDNIIYIYISLWVNLSFPHFMAEIMSYVTGSWLRLRATRKDSVQCSRWCGLPLAQPGPPVCPWLKKGCNLVITTVNHGFKPN